jgi:hypothetical protein
MQISLRGLETLEKQAVAAKTAVKKAKEQAAHAIQTVVGIAEVNSTAFSFGVINGRFGNPELLGMPLDLGVGIVLHGFAFFDIASEHMHNLANGCTASYFSALGVGVGQKMLSENQAAAQKLAAAAAAP